MISFQKKMKHLRSVRKKKPLGIDSVCLQRFAKRCGRMCIRTYIQRERERENKDEERRIKGKSDRVFDRKRKIISLEVSRQTWEEFVPRGVDWKENVIHARREEEQGWKIVLVDFDNARITVTTSKISSMREESLCFIYWVSSFLRTGRIFKINILDGNTRLVSLSFHLFYIYF